MRRGEIRWYRFAKPDKKRPVLILTRNSTLEYLADVTIAPLTTRLRDIPTQVVVTRDEGMPGDSAVSLDHIQTVPQCQVGSLLTSLPHSKMAAIENAIGFALGFSSR
jgi:mRNA interferase MazF